METIRLQKYFTDCGVLSRRAAEHEIEDGNVTVNGKRARLGDKITPHRDTVLWNGQKILPPARKQEHVYLMLNKPRGYVTTTSDPEGRKCVIDLLDGVEARVYPIGRLDKVSEGLLLLTNDGTLANLLTHPKHSIPKLYRVKVAEQVNDAQMETLTSPLVIDGYKIMPVEVTKVSTDESGTVLKMKLYEGRNRQIRKMCEQAGLTVRRLNRIAIGNLKLNALPVGKWRYLEQKEVEYLYKNAK
ncbi:MAG: rRNA pseudouridine synthase [Clostridia bacterium]|nr:rRNA pseudouridine synthase [Clostridia bacterium]